MAAVSALAGTPLLAGQGLDIDGSTAYVGFGDPASLHLSSFTIECWFRRDGNGVTTFTGPSALTLVTPLVAKGRGEDDGDNRDMNFLLGLEGTRLGVDFEEGATGASPGLNHPLVGITPIATGAWHHAAATYDGAVLRLYLDGSPEGELIVNQPPRADSIQQASVASALDSTGAPAGFFNGAVDEVRIWSHARSVAEIQAAMNQEIASAPGLVARWALDEGAGTSVGDSSGNGVNGTIGGSGFAWTSGAPALSGGQAPGLPTLVDPLDGALGVSTSPSLEVGVSDADSASLTVTFKGRQAQSSADFTIVVLPDTQFYAESFPATFTAQTQWIVDNMSSLNIVYASHLGDCVNNGDVNQFEWDNADSAMGLLEDPVSTGLVDGLPYGIAVGNWDQTPEGDPGTLADPGSTTILYNQTFGVGRFQGRNYYGGHYGSNNDNHYDLFSASGMDFIAIYLEYAPTDSPLRADVLSWADGVLKVFPSRRAIVTSHYIVDPAGMYGNQGQAIYDALKNNPNLFLMLSGHFAEAARRTDTFNGSTIHSLMSDYQWQPNGGNGWLRTMRFSPAQNKIFVRTYSPTLGQFRTDAQNEFSLDYAMSGSFATIAVNSGVAPGTTTSTVWSGLAGDTPYEWFVDVEDGTSTTTGPTWGFSTGPVCLPVGGTDTTCDLVDDDCDGAPDDDYVPTATTCGVGSCSSNTGQLTCQAGGLVDTCDPLAGATPDDVCDGLDNDCDGTPDDDYVPTATACGVGSCSSNKGELTCQAGSLVDTCDPVAGAANRELCDGVDNDCDGVIDDGNPEGGDECGIGDPGACTYLVNECSSGTISCSSGSGPAPEVARDLAFLDTESFVWTPSSSASSYSMYRGSIASPWASNLVCLASFLTSPEAVDSDAPPAGVIFYYLVSGRNSCGEGILGRASSGDTRPNSASCP